MNLDIKVTVRAAVPTLFAFAFEPDPLAILNACRDARREGSSRWHLA
jgi:hypothetical protein